MSEQVIMLWDLDGTLYPETHSMQEVFIAAACHGVRQVIDPNLSDQAVLDAMKESRKEHGASFSGYIKQGFDEAKLHKAHHDRLDHTLISRDEALIEAFKESKKHNIRHAILTHGHKDWVLRVLEQRGIREHFDENDIISVEQIGFKRKHEGPKAFEKALERLDAKASQVIMIEDKAANLKYPKIMEMKTHLLHQDEIEKAAGKYIDYVDRKFRKAEESISATIKALKNNPDPGPASFSKA